MTTTMRNSSFLFLIVLVLTPSIMGQFMLTSQRESTLFLSYLSTYLLGILSFCFLFACLLRGSEDSVIAQHFPEELEEQTEDDDEKDNGEKIGVFLDNKGRKCQYFYGTIELETEDKRNFDTNELEDEDESNEEEEGEEETEDEDEEDEDEDEEDEKGKTTRKYHRLIENFERVYFSTLPSDGEGSNLVLRKQMVWVSDDLSSCFFSGYRQLSSGESKSYALFGNNTNESHLSTFDQWNALGQSIIAIDSSYTNASTHQQEQGKEEEEKESSLVGEEKTQPLTESNGMEKTELDVEVPSELLMEQITVHQIPKDI